MRDRIFFDSNILVYSSLQDDKEKHNEVLQFLETVKGKIIFVSTQILNDVYVSLLRHKLSVVRLGSCIVIIFLLVFGTISI